MTLTRQPVPSLLEQLGALCSLLAHDLANQLCVISGSASFAQMVVSDPSRLATALEAISRATEKAGHAVSSFSEYRRTLPASFPPVLASEVTQVLVEYAESEGWKCVAPRRVTGYVLMPSQWAVFAVKSVSREIRSKTVTMRIDQSLTPILMRNQSGNRTGKFKGKRGTSLQIRLIYPSKHPFSIQEVRAQYENLELLAVFELNRMLGGAIESGTSKNGTQEIKFWFPNTAEVSVAKAHEMVPTQVRGGLSISEGM